MNVPNDITFFLAEDISFHRDLILQSLGSLGFNGKCIICKSYSEGIKKLNSLDKNDEKVDFFIAKCNFADGTVSDLVSHIRSFKKYKETPFLMVSDEENADDIIKSYESGINAYLLRPIDRDKLLEKIEYCWTHSKVAA